MRGGTPVSTPYRFTGQREEEALGLYYYGARWYDPELRRFIQPDTIVPQPGNPQALNRYSYCLNNPVRYTDPTGHDIWEALGMSNPFSWFAQLLGFPDTKKLGIPAVESLTTDIGKTYVEGLDAANQVLGPVADTGLNLMPGGGLAYDAWTAATGENILSEQVSPSYRAIAVFGVFTSIDEIVPIARNAAVVGETHAHHWIPKTFHERLQRLHPGITKNVLEFTDDIAVGFHRLTHSKWGTIDDSYNYQVDQWLKAKGTSAGLDEFLEFIGKLREEYLRLYEHYLTGG